MKMEKLTTSRRKNRKKFNWIRLAEKGKIPTDCDYYNPRVTYDGLHWFISVCIEYTDSREKPSGTGVGIDLGINDIPQAVQHTEQLSSSDNDRDYKPKTKVYSTGES